MAEARPPRVWRRFLTPQNNVFIKRVQEFMYGRPLRPENEPFAYGFKPTRDEPIPEGTYQMAKPIEPVGPPAGPQHHMPAMQAALKDNSNNEAFSVPLGSQPMLVLKGRLAALRANREKLEEDINLLETSMRENTLPPKKRRMQISTNRVTGQTRQELENKLKTYQAILKSIDKEIEEIQMQIGESAFIENEFMRAAVAASKTTRKGGRRHHSANSSRRAAYRRNRTAHRRKPHA